MTFYKDGRIYYDSIGNPTQYYNSASFEWAKGRQLQRVQLADGTYLSFRYNDEGVRTRKTVNGVETYFYLDGTNILAQKTGNDILWFNYDANGTRISITMPNGAVYYYAYNAQGDVIGLYSVNQYGYFVPQVYYTYDAWGKVLSITGNMADTLGQQNPFRYRGYYYDSETQFYYLNSRYYDPEVGRFINADGQLTTGSDLSGMNLFAYCGNDPVNRTDSTGEAWWHWALAGLVVVGCAVATVATAGGFAAAAGAITAVGSGMAAATTASTVAASAFIGAATTFGTAVLTAAVTSNSVDEFNAQGNWGTVISTAGGAVLNGGAAYLAANNVASSSRLEKYIESPQKIKNVSVQKIKKIALKENLEIGTLSKGSHKGQGFKVNWGGNRLIQYHPGGGHHGSQSYWKVSSSKNGVIRIYNDK